MIDEQLYSDVIVIPLSSQIKESDFTLILDKREKLAKRSTILCNAIKMINVKRILQEEGVLTTLTKDEIKQVEQKLLLVLDIKKIS